MKVTGKGCEVLRDSVTDEWGVTFRANTEEIKGSFIRQDRSPSCQSYILNDQKLAYVYAATIRYICTDVDEEVVVNRNEKLFRLPEEIQLDILESLNGF